MNAAAGDGALTVPVAILADNGTSGAAEVFAAALSGNKRATVVGERSQGRAGRQKVVTLPDGTGLLLTTCSTSARAAPRCRNAASHPTSPSTCRPSTSASSRRPAMPVLDKAIETLGAVKKAA